MRVQMQQLCPYQNIKQRVYPPVLAACGGSDVRVPAWGPAKWIAKLREHQQGEAPIMLLTDSDAGHFSHAANLLDNTALEYAFLLQAHSGYLSRVQSS